MNSKFVLTGGPGAGKTTVLEALSKRGCRYAPESARYIIKQRLSEGLPPRPDPIEFARTILKSDIHQYDVFGSTEEPIFFDRGVLDALYMLDAAGVLSEDEVSEYLTKYRYNPAVFLLPPWEEIYCADSERDQTFDEAMAVFAGMQRWYSQCGYDTVVVPKLSINERATFIIDTVAEVLTKQVTD